MLALARAFYKKFTLNCAEFFLSEHISYFCVASIIVHRDKVNPNPNNQVPMDTRWQLHHWHPDSQSPTRTLVARLTASILVLLDSILGLHSLRIISDTRCVTRLHSPDHIYIRTDDFMNLKLDKFTCMRVVSLCQCCVCVNSVTRTQYDVLL